jgi:hypothetical protein
MPGIWVDAVRVSERRPRSYSARQARFSMATGVFRWNRKRPPTRTGAAAISAPTLGVSPSWAALPNNRKSPMRALPRNSNRGSGWPRSGPYQPGQQFQTVHPGHL